MSDTTLCIPSLRAFVWAYAQEMRPPMLYHEHAGIHHMGWHIGSDGHTLWIDAGLSRNLHLAGRWWAQVEVWHPPSKGGRIIAPSRPPMRGLSPLAAMEDALTSAVGAKAWQDQMISRGAPLVLHDVLWSIRSCVIGRIAPAPLEATP